MTITIAQSATAIALGREAIFTANGGTAPYVYSLVSGGCGGSINSSTGVYTAPFNPTQYKTFQKILVTDDDLATAEADLVVGPASILFCEILQNQLGLAQGRVYLWDQKIKAPTDSGLFIAVSMPVCKPYANVRSSDPQMYSFDMKQYLYVMATMDMDICSRDISAFFRKDEILLALNSIYSLQQQENYGFSIAKLPAYPQFKNLSELDGAAIPYRYRISVNMSYLFTVTKDVEFYDDFAQPQVTTEA